MKIFGRNIIMLLLVPGCGDLVHGQVNNYKALNTKQESIVPIAAHLATGEQESLNTALTQGFAGASHIDLYDKPEYIPQAIKKLGDFFNEHLK